MNRLNKLIQELCPNGVRYTVLNAVCEVYDGTHQTPNYTDSGIKFVSVENIGDLYSTSKYISEEDYLKYKVKPQKDDVLMTRIGSVGSCAVVENNEKIAYYVSLALLRPNKGVLNSKFLKYAIESLHGRKELRKRTLVNAVPIKINMGDIGKIAIPLPPLGVQHEIVRILDNFTELTAELAAELTAELTARKKQYDYYSGSLFPSVNESDFDWVELGKIATVTKLAGFEFSKYVTYSDEGKIIALRGLNIKNGHLDLNDIKYIDNSELDMLNRSKLHINDMLFTYVGTVGQVALIDEEEKYYLAPNVALIRINSAEYLPKYMMYYFLTNKFNNEQILKLLQASSMKNIPMEKIRKFKLPKISVEKQQQVIKTLDRFDLLCNGITQSLSDEIEARRKQYEYYRDQLLTFNGGI